MVNMTPELIAELESRTRTFEMSDSLAITNWLEVVLAGDIEQATLMRKEMSKGVGTVADWMVMQALKPSDDATSSEP